MTGYYLEGEERFGPFTSFLYYFAGKFPLCKKIYRFVENDLKKSGAKTILDVGTGPGDIPIHLAETTKMKVYAIDPSYSMIEIAQRRSKNIRNVKFALGSSRHIPFNMKFDLIYVSSSYHHWQKQRESLNYMAKFLKKNGEIRIYEHNARRIHGFFMKPLKSHAIDVDEFRKTVKKTSLRMKKVYYSGQYVRISLRVRTRAKE